MLMDLDTNLLITAYKIHGHEKIYTSFTHHFNTCRMWQ